MINCEEFHKFIDDYVYDDVSFFVKAQLDEHIASCPKCREEVAFLREIKSALYSMPRIEVDESFKAALNQKLDASGITVRHKRKRGFLRDWRTYSALAACLVLAFVIQSRVGDFYHNHVADPVNIQSQNAADIDISGMQQTAPADMRIALPDAAQPESGEKPAENSRKDRESAGSAAVPKKTAAPSEATPKPTAKADSTAGPVKTAPVQTPSPAAPVNDAAQNAQAPAVQADVMPETAEDGVAGEYAKQRDEAVFKSTADPSAAYTDEAREDRGSAAPQVSSAGGGAAASGFAETFSGANSGTVSVDSDNVFKARQIADKYGTVNGNSIEMTKKEFQNYLNTLKKNDIEYNHNVPDMDIVDVEIVAN